MVTVAVIVLVLVGGLVHDRRLGDAGCKPSATYRYIEPEDLYSG
jgi:hypothetical protein